MNAVRMVLREAIPEDFPVIESWRAAHFLEMQARQKNRREVIGQTQLEDACWLVYEHDGVPAAAIGFRDDLGVRYVTDLFAASGKARLGWRLGALIEQMADDLGLEIRMSTDPENWHFLRILRQRGYEVAAIHLTRRACHRRE